MITRQSLKNFRNRPTYRNAPRRRVHRIGRHIELVTCGGAIVERRVWDGHKWVQVTARGAMEYALLRALLSLQSRLKAKSTPKKSSRTGRKTKKR